jgi:predicted transcriptional regulator
MIDRTLTVTLQPDWRAALRDAGRRAGSQAYAGEVLNFETPGAFFDHLTGRRWALVQALQGAGALPLRELARRVERDVKRVHEDVQALAELGLVERTEAGGVLCPFATIHIDMHMQGGALALAA